MKNSLLKTLTLVIFIVAVVLILVFKNNNRIKTESEISVTSNTKTVAKEKLPKLLDLGAHKCVPCKMMMPILDTLRVVHKGKLEVEFIDVWQDREAGARYDIKSIPTQIIYDKTGKELFRHVGFWSREEIENKIKELGINLKVDL